MLLGILVKPLDSSSIKYIKEPKIIHKIKTPKINTKIFALLARKAMSKTLDSRMYLVNFKILKILKSRKALSAIKLFVPTRNIERYLGKVDRRSTMP